MFASTMLNNIAASLAAKSSWKRALNVDYWDDSADITL